MVITVKTADGGFAASFPDGTSAAEINKRMMEYTHQDQTGAETHHSIDMGPLAAAMVGAGKSLTANYLDELTASLSASGSKISGNTRSYNDIYKDRKSAIDANMNDTASANPKSDMAGQIGGAALVSGVMPTVSARAMAYPLVPRVAAAAVDGAAYGALSGSGEGNSMSDRIGNAERGAATGMIAGPLIQEGVGPVIRKAGSIIGIKPKYEPTYVSPQHKSNIDMADNMGINITRAQATQRPSDYSVEAGARSGGYGGGPEDVAKSFDAKQYGQVTDAAMNLVNKASGPNNLGDITNMGENALWHARSMAAQKQNAARNIYAKVDKSGAAIDGNAILPLPNLIKNHLEGIYPVPPWESQVPDKYSHTLDAIATINKYAAHAARNSADPTITKFSAPLTGIDDIRKSFMRGMANARDPADRQALGEVINVFDNWTDNAFQHSLVNGQSTTIDELRKAQAIWKDYKQFAGVGNNSGERIVANAIDPSKDVQPNEFINQILGPGTSTPGGGGAVRAAEQYKRLVGTNSDGWAAIKSAAIQRAVKGLDINPGQSPNYGKVAADLAEFTDGKGRALANSLFTPKELGELNNFAKTLTVLHGQPASPAAVNRVMYAIRRFSPAVGMAVGGVLGGPLAAIAGGATAVGATNIVGKSVVKRFTEPAINRAVTPLLLQPSTTGILSGSAVSR